MRVRGDLYLAKDKGEWKVFGYDVDQAEHDERAGDSAPLWRAVRLLALGAGARGVRHAGARSSTVKPTDLALVKVKQRRRASTSAPTSSGSWRSAPTPAPART